MTELKKKVLTVLIILSTTLGLSILLANSTAQARQADIVKDLTASNPIPADRVQPFYLYFAYGSINSDTDILNAQATINMTGDGFEFVPNGIQDLYFGSPTRSDATNPPDSQPCNSGYGGSVYPLSSSLATTSSLTYGFQSSRQTSSAGGQSSPATLRAKNTGCIKLQLKVKSGATVNQQATITYDPDAATSPSYQESNRPSRQIVLIKVGAPDNSNNNSTTIGTSNLTSGTCTTVQTGSTTNCEFTLTGGSNYVLPSGGITMTVPGSSTSPACSITSGTKLTCVNVPTTGAGTGSKNVPTSLGSSPTASLTINEIPVNATTITSNNLTSGTCTTVQTGATTTCEYPLTGGTTYTLPSGGITVTVPGSTISPACSITNNTKLTCANVPTTGAGTGAKSVPTSLGALPIASLTINAASSSSSSSSSNSSSSSSSSSSTSSSTSGSTNGNTTTTPIVTTGTTTISGAAGDIKTITSPLTGISKFDVTLSDTVTNAPITYNLISGTGSCTSSVSGTPRLANSFTYGFDKAKVQQIKVTFSLASNITNIKGYSCSSPGVETNIQSLGNNQYSAIIPASATFLVTGDTVTNTSTTTRSGGFETIAMIFGISGILGVAYIAYSSRKKLGKVDVVNK